MRYSVVITAPGLSAGDLEVQAGAALAALEPDSHELVHSSEEPGIAASDAVAGYVITLAGDTAPERIAAALRGALAAPDAVIEVEPLNGDAAE